MPSDAPVYLIDGSGYIFRAFYAVPHLSRSDGFPTNALYGFTRMLLKLLQDARPDKCVLVFDAGRETFRNELYPDYKANRSECPDELVPQMPYFREVGLALGIPTVEMKGYEADDIIATLTKECRRQGQEVVIITADKDLMQLVGEGVSLWDTMRDRRSNVPEVEEKFGVGPELVPDVLGLIGDSSDNIPGVKGIGPKTAAQLVQTFGGLESILGAVAEIAEHKGIRSRKKVAEALAQESEIARLSKKLATVVDDIPLNDIAAILREGNGEGLLHQMKRHQVDGSELQMFIDTFEFASLFEGIDSSVIGTSLSVEQWKKTSTTVSATYHTVRSKDFPDWVEEFVRQQDFAFDLESTSLDVLQARVVGVSFCWNSNEAFYIPFFCDAAGEDSNTLVSWENFVEQCGPQFSDPAVQVCGHNLKYDISVLEQHGIEFNARVFDTMVAAYLLNPDSRRFSLEAVAQDMLHRRCSTFEEVVGERGCFSQVPISEATNYAAEDSEVAWSLKEHLKNLLTKHELERVAYEIDMPLVPVLSRTERLGIRLDTVFLRKLSDELASDIADFQKEIFECAGEEFNTNSPKQLSTILFEKLNLPTRGLKRTKTGISTNSSVLERLRDAHPLPGLILDYREAQKLKSTYVDALPAQLSRVSGRLHTSLNQTITGTGRLSSSEPNLQNIPLHTRRGASIRAAFVPEPGNVMISADYSQIELRVLAHLSADTALIEAFEEDRDIHERTAREILNIQPHQEVSTEQRRLGKTINFGVVYGMSSFRLARELGISVGEAQSYIDAYFEQYPGVRELFASFEKQATDTGEVRTLFGRRRVLESIDGKDRDKGFLMRAALNAPVQGSAADLIKLAMIKISRTVEQSGSPLRMLLQIHDELLFEVPTSFKDSAQVLIREEMEQVYPLRVPLKVDIGFGGNWLEAH